MTERSYTIGFLNQAQVTLYETELKGQISDGEWENAEPHDHWHKPCAAKAFVATNHEQLGPDWELIRYYDFARKDLLDVVADRMLGYVKYYSLFPTFSYSEEWTTEPLHSVSNLQGFFAAFSREEDVENGYWHKKKRKLMEFHGVTEFEDLYAVAQQVQDVPYSMEDMKRDLQLMKKVMHCRQKSSQRPEYYVNSGLDEKALLLYEKVRAADFEGPKSSKKAKRTYVDFVRGLVRAGSYNASQIVAAVLEQFPDVNVASLKTFVTDLKNPKYSAIKDLSIEVGADGVLRVVW